LENFRNPSINIHTLCNEISFDISDMLDLIEKIRPLITDCAMKSKLTTASNLLFKTLSEINKFRSIVTITFHYTIKYIFI
jgi:hypothetical protein